MHASQRQPCRTPTPAGHAAPHRRHTTSRQQQQQQRRGGGVLVQAKPGDVLLVAEGISKTYDGEKQLFGNLTFTVTAGTKLAIVGPNGAGKSTLLKILGKKDQHDAGLISRKEGALVGYLPQSDLMELEQQPQQQQPQQQQQQQQQGEGEGSSSGDMTVLQAVLESDSQVAKVVQTYQSALSEACGSITPALEAAIEAMNSHNAWGLDSEARAKLDAVGLSDPDAKVSSLSGGQRRRLSLAAALLGNPDLLILDEPTNHMDAGNKAVELVNVTLTTPDGSRQLLRDFSFEFSPGARIGIAGPNGAGKSSLLDVVAGLRQPQAGRVDVGETAVIGYFQQHPPPVPDSLRLIDYIRDVAEKRKGRKGDSGLTGPVDIPEVLLEKLGFPRKIQFQKVGSLSGGERRRLHLAAVLAATPNVLLLDEPTNDLDLNTVEVLEEVLGAYRGLLLVVSHDRAFMEGATSDLLVLPGDGSVVRHNGKYSDYLRERQQAAAAAAQQQQQQLRRTTSNGAAASTSSSNTSSSSSSNGNGSKLAASSAGSASKPAAAAAATSKGGSSNGSSKAAKPSNSKRTLGLFERQEYEKLGKDMGDLEAQLKRGSDRLNALNSSGAAWADIEALSLELAGLQAAYDAKEERWFELAEIAGDL